MSTQPFSSDNGFTTLGNIVATGNVSGGNVIATAFFGDGSQLTGLPEGYTDANVFTYLGSNSNVIITTTGNVTGTTFIGNVAATTVNATGNVSGANFVGNVVATTVSATGNVSAGNVIVNGQPTTYGVANLTTGVVAIQATATGTVAATVGNVTLSNSYSQVVAAAQPGTTIFTLPTLQPGTYLITAQAKVNGGYSAMGIFTGGSQVANTSVFSWYQPSGSVNNGLSGTWVITVNTPTVYTINAWGGGTVSASTDGTAIANYIKLDSIFALNTLATMSVTGNIAGGNITTANTVSANTVSATTFVGDGSQLTGVTTKITGTWTVPTGNSTQSITVAGNGTYVLWVRGNIPNGIIVWNATATVTNTNVPVVGQQFAWVYDGGGTPITFTSIPNQFIGTANTIVSSNVAPSTTTNRFDFGINNTSGSAQTVNWGYNTLS
jgi:hypothetical protein